MTVNYGIQAGEQAMTTGDRWPRLRPQDGERVRFHFLTDGSDPWLVATKFHPMGEGKQTRNIICLSALTQGVEICSYCDMDPTNRRNMFGCWLWVESILHPMDNPDPEGDSWEQKKIELPDGKTRAVFRENVGGKPLFLWLSAGRQKVWWAQFTNAWMVSGNLRKHLYELHRVGSGRDDTQYTLTSLKEDPLPDEVLQRDEVKNLPPVENLFRDTIRDAPSVGVLGTDSLDGMEPEPLPSATPSSMDDDDLI